MHGFFSMATFPPPEIRLLGALKMLTHLDHRLALIKHSASLPQLTNNLLRGVMPSLHIVVLLAHKGNRGLTQSWLRKQGSGHSQVMQHFLEDPIQCAFFINENWDDIEGLWESSEVQEVLLSISKRYAHVGANPLAELSHTLKALTNMPCYS